MGTGLRQAADEKQKGAWEPSWVAIQNWVKHWKDMQLRNQEMRTQKASHDMFNELLDYLNDTNRNYIDTVATKKSIEGRKLHAKLMIMLKKGTTEQNAWALRSSLMEWIGDGTAASLDKLEGIKAVVQPSPWKKPHLDEIGRMLKVLREKGAKQEEMKPEWGPPESRIIFTRGATKPQCMACWTVAKGWEVYEAALKECVNNIDATSAELIQAVRALS